MIVSVVREYKWTPHYVEGLFLDEADLFGLEYWFNDVKKLIEDLKTKK